MGLFSTKKKHHVDTAVVRVVEDASVPSLIEQALADALFEAGTGLPEAVVDKALTGSFRNIERAYHWAGEPGNYTYGRPDLTLQTSNDGKWAVKQAIQQQLKRPITLDYAHYRPLNNIHMGWWYAKTQFGHNEDTNRLDALSAYFEDKVDIYLDKMVGVHQTDPGIPATAPDPSRDEPGNLAINTLPEDSALGNFGLSTRSGATPERQSAADNPAVAALVIEEESRWGANETESIEIHYIWEDPDPEKGLQRAAVVWDLSGYDMDREYYQARYTWHDGVSRRTDYWFYDEESAQFPALDGVYDINYQNPGSYFPFVIFRSEKRNYADPALHDTQAYKSTVELCNKMNLDYQQIADSIHENPDVKDIRQAVMMFAVPITSQDPLQMEYLFEWFSSIHENTMPPQARQRPSISEQFSRSSAPATSYAITLGDADFSVTISLDGIRRTVKPGKIAEVGEFTNTEQWTSTLYRTGQTPSRAGGAGTKDRVIRRQITSGVYEEVIITNPMFRYPIARGGKKKTEGGADDERLLIPLEYNICKQLSPLKREDLYYRSLQIVFNSHIVEKVKWYQRGAFKVLMVIVAVVITLWSWGFTAPMVAGMIAAGGAALTVAVVVIVAAILQTVVLGAMVELLVEEVAQYLGVEAMAVLAVVAVLYGGHSFFTNGRVITATAENMLSAVNCLGKGIQYEIQREMGALQEEYLEYLETSEVIWEEIEEAKKALDSGIAVNPFSFIGREPVIVPGEEPEAYYNRVAHNTNPGADSLEIVQNYLSSSLTLPTINDTLGVT